MFTNNVGEILDNLVDDLKSYDHGSETSILLNKVLQVLEDQKYTSLYDKERIKDIALYHLDLDYYQKEQIYKHYDILSYIDSRPEWN